MSNESSLLETVRRFFYHLGEHMDVRTPREILVSLTYDGTPYNEPFESAEFKHYLELIGLREGMGSLTTFDLGQAHIKTFGFKSVSPWFSMWKIHDSGYAFQTYTPAMLVLVPRKVEIKF
jgi:hypothetical protein